jgi:hypothetical protein
MEMMDVSELWKLEYCNDADLNKHNPIKISLKETAYMKNNARIQKSEQETNN